MTARPRRARPARAGAHLAPITPRRTPLPAGQLRDAVLAHLRKFPHLDFSPHELAKVLNRPRSRSAIAAACRRLVELGEAVRTQKKEQRYQAAA